VLRLFLSRLLIPTVPFQRRVERIQAISSDNRAYTFQWFKDGVAITNSNQNVLSITHAGKYFVRASAGKCAANSGVVEFVRMSGAREISFEEEEKQEEIEALILSPNPTNDWLKIQYFTKENKPSEPALEIINSLGMSVISEKLEKNRDTFFSKTIDVKSMPEGIYFVRIIDGERFLVKKFIKN
jgi:hypothetical protein